MIWRCESFEKSITGSEHNGRAPFSTFDIITLVTLCFCVQTVGYLFTIACLFIPTAVASRQLQAGLLRHLWFCGLTAFVASGAGFFLSLESTRLPTVPTIIAVMLPLSLVFSLLFAGRRRHR